MALFKNKIIFMILLLTISFASVNAVLFTPGLPNIAHYFVISQAGAQQTIIWFLIGYALGQLIYGPLANRFGRKPTLYGGISLQIVSSLICALSGMTHEYWLLILGRFFMALGSGVGLKMTFTLVNEYYEPKVAQQKIAYLMLAFAITPGLGIALGGILNTCYGWVSCFYAGAIYGSILLFLVTLLPETQKVLNPEALKTKYLIPGYRDQLKNSRLIIGAILMSGATCFIYIFSALAPFIAMNLLQMNSTEYGFANILPAIGLMFGSILSAHFSKNYSPKSGIQLGILIATYSAILMTLAILTNKPPLFLLFLPMTICYFGLSLVFSNASAVAMSHASDKAYGSSVMNFINMGLATIVVLVLSLFKITEFLLPVTYLLICTVMIVVAKC